MFFFYLNNNEFHLNLGGMQEYLLCLTMSLIIIVVCLLCYRSLSVSASPFSNLFMLTFFLLLPEHHIFKILWIKSALQKATIKCNFNHASLVKTKIDMFIKFAPKFYTATQIHIDTYLRI